MYGPRVEFRTQSKNDRLNANVYKSKAESYLQLNQITLKACKSDQLNKL